MKIRRVTQGSADRDPWVPKPAWVGGFEPLPLPKEMLALPIEPEPPPPSDSDERWRKLIPLSDEVTRQVWHEADYDRDTMLNVVRDIASGDVTAADLIALYRHRRSRADG